MAVPLMRLMVSLAAQGWIILKERIKWRLSERITILSGYGRKIQLHPQALT